MADNVLWQTDDDLDEVNLTEAAFAMVFAGQVVTGLGFSVDLTDDTLDIASGQALPTNGSGRAYPTSMEQVTGLSLDSNTTNYVYLEVDTSVDEDSGDPASYHIDTDDSAPTGSNVISLKIGEVDTSQATAADAITELNRKNIDVGTATLAALAGLSTNDLTDLEGDNLEVGSDGVLDATAAPPDAQFVVLTTDGDLSAERTLDAGTLLALTDNGANGDATLDVEEGSIDHGSIAGLGDDDHPQYVAGESDNVKEEHGTVSNDPGAASDDNLTSKTRAVTSVTFSSAFGNSPTVVGQVIAPPIGVFEHVRNVSTTGADIGVDNYVATDHGSQTTHWHAIGSE